MSSHIMDFLYFVVGLFFICITSFTNISPTQLGNDTLLDSADTEYRILSERLAAPVSTTSDQSQRKPYQRKQPAEGKIKKPENSDQNTSKTKTAIAKGFGDDWWDKVQRNLALAEYLPGNNEHGLQAPNRAHNLRTYFEPTGIHLHDRTASGSPTLATLTLSKIGRGEKLESVPVGSVTQSGIRIEIHRANVIEWYENTAQGLEQGFTVAEKTTGQGALVLELTVKKAKATLRGQSIELLTDTGRKLNYGKLFVEDAKGKRLPSHLEVPAPHLIRLVMNDTKATYPLLIDPLITGLADSVLESNQADPPSFKPAAFGSNVASAGDINGDGFDDVIVGAPGWDGGDPHEGAAFIFLGSALGLIGADPATAHARIESNQFGAQLGTLPTTVVGDINGDGYDDIVVGAHNYDDVLPGTSLAVDGAAFVFHGGPLGITGTDPASANAHIHPNELQSDLGAYVSGAGDVNGDGFFDIIVGVPNHGLLFPSGIPINDRSGNYGAALVFHGSLNGITGSGFNDADAVILPYIDSGAPLLSPLGQIGSVSGLGDINGDGFDDIVLGGTEITLFLGSTTGIVGTDLSVAHQRIQGNPPLGISDSIGGAGVGFKVAGAGDVNGDGIPDVIASVPFRNLDSLSGASTEGAAYVLLGTTTGFAASSGTVSSAHASFFGSQLAENLGLDVSGIGDVNGDTFDDIAISARTFPGSLNAEGVAYIFHGSLSGISGSTLADAFVRLESQQSGAATLGNSTAVSVSGAGDINGDGFTDVIMGFPYYDAGQENEGAAFIFHGEISPINPNQPPLPIAGNDQVVVDVDSSGFATVTLDGSLSFDPDGVIVSYQWRESETILGTSAILTTALSTTGNHDLVLIVTDDAGISRGDPVTVKVDMVSSTLVGFDDFSSGNFAGGIFGWATGSWLITGDVLLSTADTFPSAPQARIGIGATLSRSVTLPAGTSGMKMDFWAKASQFAVADLVSLQVSHGGGAFTTIKTFAVTDSDNSYHFYGGSVGGGSISLSWYPAIAADMQVRFVSNTTTGLLFVDDIKVWALLAPAGTPVPPPGELPVAHAGIDITADDTDNDGLESVILDGSLSTDSDGSIVSFQWFHETVLNGPKLLGTGANLSSSFDVGTHTVSLIVTDNSGGSSADTMVVTVNPATTNNLPPIANAGPDQTIIDVDGNTLEVVAFNGTASSDPDGTIVSYVWRKNGNLYNNVSTFSITEPIGMHTVELTVTDDQGATSTDTVVITIVANTPPPPSIVSLSAAPGTISEEFNLTWTTSEATTASIDNGVGTVAVNGSVTVISAVTTTYTLTATGAGGTASSSVTVSIQLPPPEPPTVDSFVASPSTITAGASTSLSWSTTGANSVSIDNGTGTGLLANGSISATPVTTTTYTLTATGPGGTATSIQTVTVQTGSSENLNITTFEYRAGKNEWRVAGNSSISGPGNNMTIYVGSTVSGSPVLGTTNVDSLGNWSFRQKKSSILPDSSGMISIQSSQGGIWEGISGVGPAPGSNPLPSATLSSISLLPGSVAIEEGQSQQFTATGAFSDGSTTNLTTTVVWASSTAAATVNASGLASGIQAGTTNISAAQDGVTSNIATLTVTAPPPPPPPPTPTLPAQGSVVITGPTSVDRGDTVLFRVTLTNTGSTTLNGVQLSFNVNPSNNIKDLSPASTQTMGDVLPGASVTRSWNGKADREGTVTVTADILIGGASIATTMQSLTIIK